MWAWQNFRAAEPGGNLYGLYFPALPSATAAHGPHPLGAAQSPPWSYHSAHRRPPGPGYKYPALGQPAAKSAVAVPVAAAAAAAAMVTTAAATAATAVTAAVEMTAAAAATVTAAVVTVAAAAAVTAVLAMMAVAVATLTAAVYIIRWGLPETSA